MSLAYGHKMLGVYEEVKVDAISINADRRKLDPDHLKVVTKSIADRGLIQPIVLYKTPEGSFVLLAGAHRLQAMKDLKMEKIGARVYDHMLNPYELKAIEIYENLHRKNLNELERIQQTNELHMLMQRMHGPALKAVGATSGTKGHSIKDTAKILNVSVGTVHGDIKLAKLFESVPELKSVIDPTMSRTTIKAVLQRVNTIVTNRAQSAKHSANANYILGDFFENSLPANSFALIECDPPYGINLHKAKEIIDKSGMLEYEDIPEELYSQFLRKLCKECYRLGNENSWLILWYAAGNYASVIEALSEAGYAFGFTPAIWLKRNVGQRTASPYITLGNMYEQFIYARKGAPRFYKPGRGNVFDYAVVPTNKKIHATERPIELMLELINTFVGPNTSVLVPFAGSGATLVAAQQLGCSAIGFDKSEVHRNAFLQSLAKD